jgi:uncharacterized protein YbjT (DUF2867 family)
MVVIGICGITGLQGGAIADLFLKNNHKVIGITRNIQSDKSLKLLEKGATLRIGDFDNLESLNNIFNGCDVVFVVTNFWEHMDSKREFKQAKNVIDSVFKSNVNHIVWSTLEDTRDYNDSIKFIGDYKVPHFDEKGMVTKYLNGLNINSTHLYTSFFYENLTHLMKLKKDDDGVRRLCLPMNESILPLVSVLDIAKMTEYIVKNKLYGNVGVASEHLKVSEMAHILTDVLNEPVEYVKVPATTYRQFGFPGCHDLGNMFEFKDIHNKDFCKKRNMIDVNSRINPIDFKTWCLLNKDLL